MNADKTALYDMDALAAGNIAEPVIGWFYDYTPIEIMLAAGCHPRRIYGEHFATQKAGEHLPSFFCSSMCSASEGVFGGHYDFLSGLAFTNYCNAQEKVCDIVKYFSPFRNSAFFIHMMNVPRKLSPEASAYYKVSAGKFAEALGAFTGRPVTDDGLTEWIDAVNRTRQTLRALSEIVYKFETGILPSEFLKIARAINFVPIKRYNSILRDLLNRLQSMNKQDAPKKAKVLLAGDAEPDMEFVKILENTGCRIFFGDFLNDGANALNAFNGRPIDILTEKYFMKSMTTHLENSSKPLAERAAQLCDDYGADGVIFLSVKFCIQRSYDYKVLKEKMDEKGVPVLLIENDYSLTSYEQSKTRIQAFVEIL